MMCTKDRRCGATGPSARSVKAAITEWNRIAEAHRIVNKPTPETCQHQMFADTWSFNGRATFSQGCRLCWLKTNDHPTRRGAEKEWEQLLEAHRGT